MAPTRIQFAYKVYRRNFRVPVRTSQERWEAREGILLRVETEAGEVAWGEIAPIERFGTETLAGAVAWCATVGSRSDLEQLCVVPRDLPCCAAAVSAITAKLSPMDDTDKTNSTAQLPVAMLLPTGPASIEVLSHGLDRGFTHFKIKIGAVSFEEEQTMLLRLVEQLPANARLRCDANGACDVRTAARWLAAAAEWPVEFIEQPLPPASVNELLAMAHDFSTPLALDESVRGPDDIKRWRDRGWRGLFVIKPGLAGDRAALLEETRMEPGDIVFSSALETAIGMKSGIELALAAGVRRALGYGVGAFFEDDGLGGGCSEPVMDAASLGRLDPADIWNRL